MRDVLLNLTASLDGFIADQSGGIDWLLTPPQDVPSDYVEHMAMVDALVMGRATYETSLALEGGVEIFEGKRVYVFTSRDDLAPRSGVSFISERPETFVERLKAEDGGTIWLFGGGLLATALAEAGLIDEYLIAIQPILLGEGIPLWRSLRRPVRLECTMARQWSGGLVELRYRKASTS
jgi:dihydrofolate reductase